jgi:hypothetical protein
MSALVEQEDDIVLDSFYAGGPNTFQEAFPPVCLKSHWDAAAVSRHVLPASTGPQGAQLALDPRQYAQICRQYYNESPADALPAGVVEGEPILTGDAAAAPTDVPTPPGGAAGFGFPYSGYSPDAEADMWRYAEALTKCSERRYQPTPQGLVETQTNAVPGANAAFDDASLFVSKLAGCRSADDNEAWNRSARTFFNSTKLDRYTPTAANGPLACGGAPAPGRGSFAPGPAPTSVATAELRYATLEQDALTAPFPAPGPTSGSVPEYAALFRPSPYA